MKIVPTADEVKRYKEYSAQNNGSYDGTFLRCIPFCIFLTLQNDNFKRFTFTGLTIEDQFLAQFVEIERLQQKLQIM